MILDVPTTQDFLTAGKIFYALPGIRPVVFLWAVKMESMMIQALQMNIGPPHSGHYQLLFRFYSKESIYSESRDRHNVSVSINRK